MNDPLLTRPQVAQRLTCSVTTVLRLVRDGALPEVRVRGASRIPSSAVERYIADQLDQRDPEPVP